MKRRASPPPKAATAPSRRLRRSRSRTLPGRPGPSWRRGGAAAPDGAPNGRAPPKPKRKLRRKVDRRCGAARGAGGRRLVWPLLLDRRALSGLDRRRLCRAPRTPRSPPRCRAMSRRSSVEDNAQVRAGDVIAKIDDGDYRLAVDSRARQGRDPAGDDRPHRQADRGAAGGDRSGQGAARLRAGRRDARRARTRAPAGARRRATTPASRRSKPRKPTRRQTAAAVQGAQAAVEAARGEYRCAPGAAGRSRAHARRN